ncbi:MAG: hypothetical protein KGY45_03200, partial [Hadesarchaea archaeon]|nr:hypothetical protein [Hadesarchaea archaeon]
NASAPGYLSKNIAGNFVNGEETIVKIDLNKNTGDLTLNLKNKEGVISRSWKNHGVEKTREKRVLYEFSNQVTSEDSEFYSRIKELNENPNKEPIITRDEIEGKNYYLYREFIGYQVKLPKYKTNTIEIHKTNNSLSSLLLLAKTISYQFQGYSLEPNYEYQISKINLNQDSRKWTDTGGTSEKWFYESKPNAEKGYRWVCTGNDLLGLKKHYKKQFKISEYYKANNYSINSDTAIKETRILKNYTGTKRTLVGYENIVLSENNPKLLEYEEKGYEITKKFEDYQIPKSEYDSNPKYYDQFELEEKYIPENSIQRLIGYKKLSKSQDSSGWVSNPQKVESKIILDGSYNGPVKIQATGVPSGIRVKMSSSAESSGELIIKNNLESKKSKITGEINASESDSEFIVNKIDVTQVRLAIEIDSSKKSMLGTYLLTISASIDEESIVSKKFRLIVEKNKSHRNNTSNQITVDTTPRFKLELLDPQPFGNETIPPGCEVSTKLKVKRLYGYDRKITLSGIMFSWNSTNSIKSDVILPKDFKLEPNPVKQANQVSLVVWPQGEMTREKAERIWEDPNYWNTLISVFVEGKGQYAKGFEGSGIGILESANKEFKFWTTCHLDQWKNAFEFFNYLKTK